MDKQDPRYLRGARSFVQGRFESVAREAFDDGWTPEEPDQRELKTQVTIERARSIVSHNDSPDVGFSQSINPYRGCEHGCIYCYARPSHAYLELSPGLDFETKLFAKTNAAELLRETLAKPGYQPSPIALGANTDCYQPIERKYRITRQILEVLAECEHPVTMVTKSALIERDLDLLGPDGAEEPGEGVRLDRHARSRARAQARAARRQPAAPAGCSESTCSEHRVPCGVMVAALIPALNDKTMEHVLEAAAAAGATRGGVRHHAAAERAQGAVQGMARRALPAARRARDEHRAPDARREAKTTRTSAAACPAPAITPS